MQNENMNDREALAAWYNPGDVGYVIATLMGDNEEALDEILAGLSSPTFPEYAEKKTAAREAAYRIYRASYESTH